MRMMKHWDYLPPGKSRVNVERDISKDEMTESEIERIERILSNDYWIIENVWYEISREEMHGVFVSNNIRLTKQGGSFQMSSFLSAGCNCLHRLQLNISFWSRFSQLIKDWRQSSSVIIAVGSSLLTLDRSALTLGWRSTSCKQSIERLQQFALHCLLAHGQGDIEGNTPRIPIQSQYFNRYTRIHYHWIQMHNPDSN